MAIEVHKMKTPTTQPELSAKVLLFAISSRIFVIFLSWISNTLIPDHNAGVFIFPQPDVNRTLADIVIQNVFGGLARWDAQYFLHIAQFGYTYENTLAFFPLFPFFTRILALTLGVIFKGVVNSVSVVLVSAVLINFFFFVNAAVKLFQLSRKILKDDTLAYKSALFFCINPASIFFTAPYSESCFAFFTFSGMLLCVENNNELLSSVALGLSSCVRSNAVLNFGYLAHKNVKNTLVNVQLLKLNFKFSSLFSIATQFCKLCICALVFFAPFILFQGYAFITFCSNEYDMDMADFLKEYGKLNSFLMPSSKPPPWCKYTIPLSYSYVQNHYWDVGFLKYYHLKQIPNFMLAAPVILLVLKYSYHFMLENRNALISLGLDKSEYVTFRKKELMPDFFVFVVHAVFLTIFCMLFVHIQVTTRMIASSSPVLYWLVALRYKTETNYVSKAISSRLKTFSAHKFSLVESQQNMASVWRTLVITEKPGDTWSYVVRTYFYSYVVVGTILFSNFLPWT